jgi:hypothetical protein
MTRRWSVIAVGSLTLAVATLSLADSQAMQLKLVDHQLILSGPVVGDELAKLAEALAKSPDVDTVILRNSPGGNAPAGYQVGQLLRERGLRTAVSGFCYSSCSRMFLGGRRRSSPTITPRNAPRSAFMGTITPTDA